jgi:hypothetical protein
MPLGMFKTISRDLQLSRTHKHTVNVSDVNLLGENINTIKKSIEVTTYAKKEAGIGINIEKTE